MHSTAPQIKDTAEEVSMGMAGTQETALQWSAKRPPLVDERVLTAGVTICNSGVWLKGFQTVVPKVCM